MKWISINKELPPLGQWVLVYDPEMDFTSEYGFHLYSGIVSRIRDSVYLNDSDTITVWKSITHWMPLPEMPEE